MELIDGSTIETVGYSIYLSDERLEAVAVVFVCIFWFFYSILSWAFGSTVVFNSKTGGLLFKVADIDELAIFSVFGFWYHGLTILV